jgi:gluconate kinase
MNPALLDSQFQTLEEPEDALRIDVRLPPDEIVTMIRNHFKL